ncbi:hypothetical protein KQX54_009668 [Cotesia glomerata]|uniref:Uncharacterized protein n=1 Tax=Cotesia glomerata TaxID=32391 RepID=A0AAV7J0M6_COTGL|nr:hypothetical protein KQX54_009668 [Cotesia glomerata]
MIASIQIGEGEYGKFNTVVLGLGSAVRSAPEGSISLSVINQSHPTDYHSNWLACYAIDCASTDGFSRNYSSLMNPSTSRSNELTHVCLVIGFNGLLPSNHQR